MNTPKKNLALLELIIVILFFALSAVVLTQVFVKAKAIGDASRAETLGLITAQDVLERLKGAPYAADAVFAELGWKKTGQNTYAAGLDGNMGVNSQSPLFEGRAVVAPQKLNGGTFYDISVEISRVFDGQNVTGLSTGRFAPNTEAQ